MPLKGGVVFSTCSKVGQMSGKNPLQENEFKIYVGV